jgi:hypothetical protein
MLAARGYLSRASNHVARQIALRWTETFPQFYVSEYPKSGGTWLAKMLAHYLRVPLPQRPLLPVLGRAVVHNHWPFDARMRRVVYISRDGRDVMTSLYFHRVRVMRDASHVGARRVGERYRRLFGDGWDADDVRRYLPRFIEEEFRSPFACPQAWSTHVETWRRADPHRVVQTRYEELLADGPGALARIVTELGEAPVHERIAATVDAFSFERVTGRARGTEDRGSFARRGVAGDWRNHFTREAADVFDRLAGDTLIALGYERDRSWVASVERFTASASRTP